MLEFKNIIYKYQNFQPQTTKNSKHVNQNVLLSSFISTTISTSYNLFMSLNTCIHLQQVLSLCFSDGVLKLGYQHHKVFKIFISWVHKDSTMNKTYLHEAYMGSLTDTPYGPPSSFMSDSFIESEVNPKHRQMWPPNKPTPHPKKKENCWSFHSCFYLNVASSEFLS